MMRLEVIKIRFKDAPLHLSDGRGRYYVSDDILHADTLKNAFFAAAGRILGPSVFQSSFYDQFLLSSGFPFLEEEYFFPRPKVGLSFYRLSPRESKGVRFLGKNLFELFAQGDPKISTPLGMIGLNDGEALTRNIMIAGADLYERQVQDRVNLNTLTPFYMETLRFHEAGGVFFAVKFLEEDNSAVRTKIMQALESLSDEGLGSDKAYGFGKFDIIKAEGGYFHSIELDVPQTADFQMNLGPYRPNNQEIQWLKDDLPRSAFQVMERGGFIAEPANPEHLSYRKHKAMFFSPGSIFPTRPGRKGEKINLQPESVSHPVWREGASIFIPIHKHYVEL